MSFNRIQKLLLSEYCDFEDLILVESPFAQTDRDGKGLRQVNLGLTPTKLIIAADVVNWNKNSGCKIFRNLDVDIVDFELISVLPLEYAHISIFHRRRKCTIKVKFCTNKVWYFELGGTEKRQTIWRIWCDKINYINRNEQNSASETSAGSSSTASKSSFSKNLNKIQVWCTLNRTGCNLKPKTCNKWTDKYIFMGDSFEENPLDYTPIVYFPTEYQLLCALKEERSWCKINEDKTRKETKFLSESVQEKTFHVNRFGEGVDEKCLPGLYLPAERFMKAKQFYQKVSKISEESAESDFSETIEPNVINIWSLVDEAVKVWECLQSKINCQASKPKHERKYALQPNLNISQIFGIWNVQLRERYSNKSKRIASEVNVLRDNDVLNYYDKKILYSTESLDTFKKNQSRLTITNRACPFWIHKSHYDSEPSRKNDKTLRTKFSHYLTCQDKPVSKRNHFVQSVTDQATKNLHCSNFISNKDIAVSETFILYKRAFSNWSNSQSSDESCISSRKPSVKDLTRILRMELNLTAWDFDSGTLAYQLTLIDRDLFLEISATDITNLIFQRSANNSPNLKKIVIFSYRITCLVATEILKNDSKKARARMIARFINTANGCKRIANFESCTSIMNGLQIPAIYRLKKTWNHLRKFHSTQYQMFYDLRSTECQRSFLKVEKKAPCFLPHVGYFIQTLLGKNPENEEKPNNLKSENSIKTSCSSTSSSTNIVRRLLSRIRVSSVGEVGKLIETKSNKNENTEIRQLSNNENYTRLQRGLKILKKYHCAAENYRIKRNKLVREYLLRAKYDDEYQLFRKSLTFETSNYALNKC